MSTLVISDKDTRPIVCQRNLPFSVGDTVKLKVATSPETVITGTVTDAASGLFQFPRTSTTFTVGSYAAEILITDAAGEETTEPFTIQVVGRLP